MRNYATSTAMFMEKHKHAYKHYLYIEDFLKQLVFHRLIFYRRELRYRTIKLLTLGCTSVIHSSKPIAIS